MEALRITNREQLKAEIWRLKGVDDQLVLALHERVENPKAVLSTIGTLFQKRDKNNKIVSTGFFRSDNMKLLSRLAIPFVLNRTLFRRSSLLVKAMVNLVSQKAISQVSKAGAVNLLDKGKVMLLNTFNIAKRLLSKQKGNPPKPLIRHSGTYRRKIR
jgi:hypothetical protein